MQNQMIAANERAEAPGEKAITKAEGLLGEAIKDLIACHRQTMKEEYAGWELEENGISFEDFEDAFKEAL